MPRPTPPTPFCLEPLEGRRLLAAADAVVGPLLPDEAGGHGCGCACPSCARPAHDAALEAHLPGVPTDRLMGVEEVEARRAMYDAHRASHAQSPAANATDADSSPAGIERLRGGFNLWVNFQPADATEVPAGFVVDLGREYHKRGNGRFYGWSKDIERGLRDRNAPGFSEQFDTLVHTHGATWEAAVPNGFYLVGVVAGDADFFDSDFRYSVEGTPTVRATPDSANRFIEGIALVEVTDGRLSVSTDDGAQNAKLNYVQITQVQPPPPVGQGPALEFDRRRDGPIDRVEPARAELGGKVYVMGGYVDNYSGVTSRVDVYDKATDTWGRAADLPGAESHMAAASDGRYVYVIGGQVGPSRAPGTDFASNLTWRYDPAADSWEPWVPLPELRLAGTAVYWNNSIHFVGGTSGDGVVPRADHWRFNFDVGHWQKMPDLPRRGDHLGSALIGDVWYVVGGEHGHGTSYVQHRDVFAYDHTLGYWVERAPLPEALSHFEGNILAHDGELLVLGGRGNAEVRSEGIYSYSPPADLWSTRGTLFAPRFGGASWIDDGELFFYAGDTFGRTFAEVFAAELE